MNNNTNHCADHQGQTLNMVRGNLSNEKAGRLVFGFDLGIGSVGFAALDVENEKILYMASHLSSAPEVSKNHQSLAEQRRRYRSSRRVLDRRKTRRKKIAGLLAGAGLMPQGAEKDGWFGMKKGESSITFLRAAALNRPLTDRELARVLMYFCRHRGYIDQGTGEPSDSEDGKMLAAIAENRGDIGDGRKWRTAGEMLNEKGARHEPTRNSAGDYSMCIPHDLIRDEAGLIIDRQREFGHIECTPEFKARYLEALSWLKPTYERDLKVYERVGFCTYGKHEPGSRTGNRASREYARAYIRAASATLTAEREAALERLVHISLFVDGKKVSVPHNVRMAAYETMFDVDKKVPDKGFTFKWLRSLLNKIGPQGAETMRATDRFNGVKFEDEGKTAIYKPVAFAKLQGQLKTSPELFKRLVQDCDLYDDVAEALTFASSRESYRHRLVDLKVTERLHGEDLEAIEGLPFNSKVFKSYGSRSLDKLDALSRVLINENIHNLYEAEVATGLEGLRTSNDGSKGSLLPPYERFDPGCTNPVVLHIAARFRKVFNQAVRTFGKPDVVRIELGSELKASSKVRREIERNNKKRMKQNTENREELAREMGVEPEEVKGSLLEKKALYKSQNGIDLYTGKPISYERLLDDMTYAETDHILPKSRSFDNRMTNKVLTLTKSNRDKKERTPYEWMTSGEDTAPSWDEFRARVQKLYKDIPSAKYTNLLDADFAKREHEEGFIERHLSDTRYLSRMLSEWVKATISFDDPDRVHVFAVSGGATGGLRHAWGIRKDRNDGGRHHAADAAVIAACTPALVKKCAAYGAERGMIPPEERDKLLEGTMPWPGFASQVRAISAGVIPTRSESHDFSGQATEDTAFSFVGYNAKGKMLVCNGNGEVKAKTNFVFVSDDCTVKANGKMALLRLWLDSEAKAVSGKKGEYLCEPVYYSDLPMINSGDYRPRYCKKDFPCREKWPLVPSDILKNVPIVIHRGDAVVVGDSVGRFMGMDISDRTMKWEPVAGDISTPPSLSNWTNDTFIEVVQEDALGLCWDCIRKNLERYRS